MTINILSSYENESLLTVIIPLGHPSSKDVTKSFWNFYQNKFFNRSTASENLSSYNPNQGAWNLYFLDSTPETIEV